MISQSIPAFSRQFSAAESVNFELLREVFKKFKFKNSLRETRECEIMVSPAGFPSPPSLGESQPLFGDGTGGKTQRDLSPANSANPTLLSRGKIPTPRVFEAAGFGRRLIRYRGPDKKKGCNSRRPHSVRDIIRMRPRDDFQFPFALAARPLAASGPRT